MNALHLASEAAEAGHSELGFPLLPAITLLPVLGALFIALLPKRRPELAKMGAIITALGTLALTLYMLFEFETDDPGFQFVSSTTWIQALDIKFEEAEARPLGDCAEVQDLLAAMDAVVSHTNDVAVARILKSPMFGVSDEALLFMAGARRLSGWRWFSLLQDKERIEAGAPEGDVEKLHRAGAALSALSREAKELPPHDLLDAILARTGYAERCMAVLSPDRRVAAAKAIDALLSKALALNGGRYSTPYAFVRELRAKTVKHPSTAGEGGVRLLTVHGAKGLEAPVVFIIDTQPEAKRVESASVLVRWEVEDQAPAMCAFVTSKPPSSLALIAKAETALQRREEMNGLYVALTRAAELVVVSSTEPYAYDKEGVSWWDRIYDHAARWSVDEEAAADAWKAHQAASGVAVEDVATLRLPSLGERAQGAVKVAGAMMQSRFKDGGYAANFGHTVHRVMEWCTPTTVSPGLDRTEAAAVERLAADACVENFLPPSESAVVAAQCRSMLDAPVLAKLLVDGNWKWAGNEVTLSGDPRSMRADRMVCFDEGGLETWWVLDYKRDVQPQEREEYVSQLLGYRALVQRMVGSKSKVMAAFITGGSELRVIDGVRTSLDGAGEGQAVATAEVA